MCKAAVNEALWGTDHDPRRREWDVALAESHICLIASEQNEQYDSVLLVAERGLDSSRDALRVQRLQESEDEHEEQ